MPRRKATPAPAELRAGGDKGGDNSGENRGDNGGNESGLAAPAVRPSC
jgi:hypothetical protein